MKSLQEFLQNFFKNKGQYVFFSLLIAKICGLISSIAVVRMLPQSDFGMMTIVASVFAVFATFSGFGSAQGFLRFGAIAEQSEEKEKLHQHFFLQGFLYQLILSVLFILSSIFFVQKYGDVLLIFIFFTIRLIGFYFFNHIQSYFRVYHDNKNFARVNNVVNVFGLILIIILTYFFGLKGYLFAISVAPFLSLFWFFKYKILNFQRIKLQKKELWSYSFHAVFTAFLSDLLFSLDILLLGFLLNENAVADYKVAIILPSNLTFLAVSMLQADFPKIAKNAHNQLFVKDYISNYYKIFIPICLVILGVSFFFAKEILTLFFSSQYAHETQVFLILVITFLMNMLFRNLFGNLLSAVGEMKKNTIISIFSLIVLAISAFILVPKFQILGMGISVFLAMSFSGFLGTFFFWKYFKKLG
jgi:O-antigen/teichoic acid export membrane protein